MAEAQPVFDAAKYKSAQHDQWNEDAAAWNRWGPTLQRWFGNLTKRMLDLAELGQGQRVLDIASGAGEPALSAAERVGPDGYLLATDLSEKIIAFAQQIAEERHLRNFETRVSDGENLELPDASFDAVLCRFGLMYMPDRHRALTEWRRVLRPEGRVVVAVFSTPDKNGWGAVPLAIIRQSAQLAPPLPGQPGSFSLRAKGILEDALRQADFQSIQIHRLSAPLRMASAAECIRFERESFGAFNQVMAHLPREEREAICDEVEVAMQVFEGPEGFQAPCEALLAVGTK
ncbi:MAG TPA: methyltransferase domain-containing protein [Terrimicrobium sp.]